MVHAHVADPQFVRRRAEQCRDAARNADRRVAHADDVHPRIFCNGILNETAGVGEVDQQSARRNFLDNFARLQRHRDRAPRVVHPSRPERFLAWEAEGVRERFVVGPRWIPADAHLIQNVVRALHRAAEIGGAGHGDRPGGAGGEARAHGGDLRQFVLRAPVQNNINRRAVGARAQCADQFRRGNTTAAEDSEFDCVDHLKFKEEQITLA